jgi:aflatoxin B1 aldehyde reductase
MVGILPVPNALHVTLTSRHPSSTGIIMGVSSQAQLEQNIKDCEKGPLPQDVAEAFEQGWKVISGSAPSYYDGHGTQKYGYDTIQALYGKGAL